MTHVISEGTVTEVLPVMWLETTMDGVGQPEPAHAKLSLCFSIHLF